MNEKILKKNKIEELLSRGVEEIIDKTNLEKKLKDGKQLRIKLGIDPTSPNIHLGRSIPLLKLKDFQELGHQIVLIIGDFTGLIGDTSDKDSERPMLSEEAVKKNLKTYIEQAAKIIDIDKAEICYNSKWLEKLKYMDIGRQADAFSLNEFISRENISRRLEAGKRVSLRELLYPLMQGYDSVEVRADVEIGGTDQRFNLLAGRDLQRLYAQEVQDIITNPLIEGLDGRKMSSSLGNTINLFDMPNDMFGKIMSLHDNFIIKYFILLTRVEMNIINGYIADIKEGINPRDLKMKLAFEIVRIYHSEKEAEEANDYFIKTFSKKEIPKDLLKFKPDDYRILSVLVLAKLVSSKTDAKRIIDQGGVKIDGIVVNDINCVVMPGSVLQKGKINFIEIL
ncbi:MAG: tyrosine--tRNA ligase [Candidatus Falkowbacteria bacterium]|nr:tyrosine--tRNA ligase [Candidatus Falkowbacteria bacterium]